LARVAHLAPEEMTPQQRKLHDEIAAVRGGAVGGPFAIWLRTPAIADNANRLGNALRLDGTLDRRLFELAVLVVARHWSAQYEWHVHAEAAATAGLSPELIESIRTRSTPSFSRPEEAIVHAVSWELLQSQTLSTETYSKAVEVLGLDQVIELVTVLGFYTTAALMLNAFEVAVPGGGKPLA
jgi:4-carboxymuconolactone decarboxylase